MEESAPGFESKLIPIMREGVEVVKMVCFRKLGSSLAERYPERDPKFRTMLTGAVLNKMFGVTNQQEPFASFAAANRELIDEQISCFAGHCPDLRIPLTDALRIQALCDRMAGAADDRPLEIARAAGILLADRVFPLPPGFLDMVRRIGKSYGLVIPPLPAAG
ncbi:MAG: hypothetical protein P1P81_05585 [Desulfobulbales bacterium]|nr:hypothetical protein [Desulfobulbales bacterium]